MFKSPLTTNRALSSHTVWSVQHAQIFKTHCAQVFLWLSAITIFILFLCSHFSFEKIQSFCCDIHWCSRSVNGRHLTYWLQFYWATVQTKGLNNSDNDFSATFSNSRLINSTPEKESYYFEAVFSNQTFIHLSHESSSFPSIFVVWFGAICDWPKWADVCDSHYENRFTIPCLSMWR